MIDIQIPSTFSYLFQAILQNITQNYIIRIWRLGDIRVISAKYCLYATITNCFHKYDPLPHISLSVLYCIVLHCIALHCNVVLYCIALHCTTLHCITLHCIPLHSIILYYIILYYIILYYIILYYIILYYIILYYIILYTHRSKSHMIFLQ